MESSTSEIEKRKQYLSQKLSVGDFKVIYFYTIPNSPAHVGHIKVGDATLKTDESLDDLLKGCEVVEDLYTSGAIKSAARKRIDEQTKTAGVEYTLLGAYLALRPTKDGEHYESFRDYDVHRVLLINGYTKEAIRKDNRLGEWFSISQEIAEKALRAVVWRDYRIKDTEASLKEEIILRPEQKKAVKETLSVFKKGTFSEPKYFLWNAIMRFGKTLTAYELIKEMSKREEITKVLILTHRPVVRDGWREDFIKVFGKNEWAFASKAREDIDLDEAGDKFFYFASIQDLRGSFTSKDNDEADWGNEEWTDEQIQKVVTKNSEIFATNFDVAILDEAHEGLKTSLAKQVFALIKKRYELKLSGTPFNIIEDYSKEHIYTWSYLDEQKAKEDWAKNFPHEPNPYGGLPDLEIRTIDLTEALKNELDISPDRIYFNFREFFKVDPNQTVIGEVYKNGYHPFLKPGPIKRLLDLMTSSVSKIDPTTGKVTYEVTGFPFSSERAWVDFADTLWVLPTIDSTRALHEMIASHNNFHGVKVVNASGNNDSGDPLKDVQDAIKGSKKTITLSVGKLTTGTTVPEWTAVLMMSNMKSAMHYMQTIFRGKTSGALRDGRAKETAYVFDFDPDRAISTIIDTGEQNAKPFISRSMPFTDAEAERKKQIDELIKYLPIISFDGVKFQKSNSRDIMKRVQRIYIDRAADSGFYDLRLFDKEAFADVTAEQLGLFKTIAAIVKKNTSDKEMRKVTISESPLSKEAKALVKDGRPLKERKDLTPEEEAAMQEAKEFGKNRQAMMVTLRGIAVRIPLMVLAMDRVIDEKGNFKPITVENFTDDIDDESWKEFMPKGFKKKGLDEPSWELFVPFFNSTIFEGAVQTIQRRVDDASRLPVMERIPAIANLFVTFRNPDKETVLTPWHVVSLQYSQTLGGLQWTDFESKKWFASDGELHDFDEVEALGLNFEPRWVSEQDAMWDDPDVTIMDINSKTALYPLYAAASLWWRLRKNTPYKLSEVMEEELWKQIVENHIFVNCRVPYSASIAQRVLAGYNDDVKVNASVVDVIEVRKKLKEVRVPKGEGKKGTRPLTNEEEELVWRSIFNPEAIRNGSGKKLAEEILSIGEGEGSV